MKIAIISDTHDNLANIKKIIDWLNKEEIKLILHCGDVSSQETLDEIKKLFNGEIKIVRGNADVNLIDIPEFDEVETQPRSDRPRRSTTGVDNTKIAFTHFSDKAKKLAGTKKYKIVFFGHTHKPWLARLNFSKKNFGGEEKIGDCRLINPGEAGGQFYKPTFAVYDTSTSLLELKILEKI